MGDRGRERWGQDAPVFLAWVSGRGGPARSPWAKPGVGPKGGRERLLQGAEAGRGPGRGVKPQKLARGLSSAYGMPTTLQPGPLPGQSSHRHHWRPLAPRTPAQALGSIAKPGLALLAPLPVGKRLRVKARGQGLPHPPPRSSQSAVWRLRKAGLCLGAVQPGRVGWGGLPAMAVEGRGGSG